MRNILQALKDIYILLTEIKQRAQRRRIPLENRRRYTKQEVIDKLKMSESTYKRNLKSGLLNPIRLNGFDEYFEEDLIEAMEQSRIKGRF